ncbi:MAG TPA: S1C family serine protease [Bryobacteraceae bacterium]
MNFLNTSRVLLASVLLTAALPAQDGDFSRQYRRAVKSVVTIYTSKGSGSGFGVAMHGSDVTTVIATNAHVVGTDQYVSVVTSDRSKFSGKVIARYADTDIAFIECSCVPSLPLAGGFPDIGSRAYVIGSPGLSPGVLASGTLTSGVVGNILVGGIIQVDASINYGNSGGPVLNSRGEVIGMASAFAQDKPGLNFAVSVVSIQGLIPDYWTELNRQIERNRRVLSYQK